jgi:hypothetical protein
MSASITAHPVAIELLVKLALAHVGINDIAKRSHTYILNLGSVFIFVRLAKVRLAKVRLADAGEFEDGAQVAPAARQGTGDCGLRLLDSFVFFRVVGIHRFAAGFLSPLRSWIVFCFCPTACDVGCVLSPLCGWFCDATFLRCVLWFGLGFELNYGIRRGFAGGGARATWIADRRAEFGVFD